MVDRSSGHLQAAVMDTTQSHRAQEGFEYTVGALVSTRVYKPAIDYDRTFEIMTAGDEKTNPVGDFSPTVHKVFLDNYDFFTELHADLKD